MSEPAKRVDAAMAALVEEPRGELAVEVADRIGELIRTTPQERPLFGLGGRRVFRPDVLDQRALVRLLAVTALAAAMVAALLAFGSRRPPLPENGLVVFGSDRAGLFVGDVETGEHRQLVAPWPANPSGRTNRADLIAISPRGDRMAYIVAGIGTWSIPILDLPSGGVAAELVDDGRGVVPEWAMQWSHDASRLFIEATVGGLGRIVAADPATGALLEVGSPNAVGRDVAASPVDGRIAFVQSPSAFDDEFRLVIWDPATGQTTEVTTPTADASSAAKPAWSPDGRSVAMTITRADGTSAIGRVDLDGGALAILTPWTDRWPAAHWSPDGARLLIAVVPQGGREADVYTNDLQPAELFLVDADGTRWRPMVAHACSNVAWSPDGASILYERGTCDGGDTAELRVIGVDGRGDRAVWIGDPGVTSRLSIGWQADP